MEYHTFTIREDTRWPVDENGERPLRAYGNRGSFTGWWRRDHFDEWLRMRHGSIVSDDGAEMKVLAELTKREAKRGFR